mmetsp:Transcript_26370/g.68062  ORF Transcript_26370/g.68062 Transcript_26370/m.68062 type:complete len:94 (-) Transcript_26370:129-410(-)
MAYVQFRQGCAVGMGRDTCKCLMLSVVCLEFVIPTAGGTYIPNTRLEHETEITKALGLTSLAHQPLCLTSLTSTMPHKAMLVLLAARGQGYLG